MPETKSEAPTDRNADVAADFRPLFEQLGQPVGESLIVSALKTLSGRIAAARAKGAPRRSST